MLWGNINMCLAVYKVLHLWISKQRACLKTCPSSINGFRQIWSAAKEKKNQQQKNILSLRGWGLIVEEKVMFSKFCLHIFALNSLNSCITLHYLRCLKFNENCIKSLVYKFVPKLSVLQFLLSKWAAAAPLRVVWSGAFRLSSCGGSVHPLQPLQRCSWSLPCAKCSVPVSLGFAIII